MDPCAISAYMFQSTPPHGRRRFPGRPERRRNRVSIHASAREATVVSPGHFLSIEVSIHASAREATRGKASLPYCYTVSIHASAREATPAALL